MNPGRYKGLVFMYPCAGADLVQPFLAYADQFDTFLFVDIGYQFRHFQKPVFPGWKAVEGSVIMEGPPVGRIRPVRRSNHSFREVEPAWWHCRYENSETKRTVELVLRRGFGQYALRELNAGQLGMFLHRGDSAGEGGSGTQFLANRPMRHPPLSKLMDVIATKLSCPALIASDGSNTPIRQLVAAANCDESVKTFTSHAMTWERRREVRGKGRRRTVVWEVLPFDSNYIVQSSLDSANEMKTSVESGQFMKPTELRQYE